MGQILFEWTFESDCKNYKMHELNLKLKDELGI